MQKEGQDIQVFWFRRDLRLHDNRGWYEALKDIRYPVLPLFIFDSDILASLPSPYDTRVDAIRQMLQQLNKELQELGTSLVIEYGKPIEIFAKLVATYSIAAVHTNRDYEPYATKRDKEVELFLQEKQIAFSTHKDQVVYEPGEILKPDGKPYTIFTPYAKTWAKKISIEAFAQCDYTPLAHNVVQRSAQDILSLADIGFQRTSFQYNPPSIPYSIIENYENTRNFPAIKGTSELGMHLRFGTISIRQLSQIAYERNHTFLSELIWREFFMGILFHFPHVQTRSFKPAYDAILWINDEAQFARWCEGTTGYPMVDAGMRQLNTTGLMHNRVRMVVASFLCKHLLIDWRWGEAYFASKLMDYDLSANNGNWQWAAGCGCDAAPYFRVFNPSEQVKKFDPQHNYIQQWIPEYNTLAYPQPIVNHAFARNRAIETYKYSLAQEKTNNM